MGLFSLGALRRLRIPLFTDQQRFILEEYADYVDDNTEAEGAVDADDKRNIVGYHAFPSLKKMSLYYGKSYPSLLKAKQEIVEMDLLQEAELQISNSTITYSMNFSKLFRLGDYYETVRELKLDENDEDVKKFFESAFRSYEDDYLTFPVRTLKKREKPMVIKDWKNLVDAGDDALERYWRTYREKSIGADGNNTNTYDTTKEHDSELSSSNHNIDMNDDENQEFPTYQYSKEQYPYEKPFFNKNDVKILQGDFERFTHTTLSGKKIWLEFSEKSMNDQGKFDMEIVMEPIKSYKEKNRFRNSRKGKELSELIEEYNTIYLQALHYLVYKKHHPEYEPEE